jgi:hypothetical protein
LAAHIILAEVHEREPSLASRRRFSRQACKTHPARWLHATGLLLLLRRPASTASHWRSAPAVQQAAAPCGPARINPKVDAQHIDNEGNARP